MKRLEFSVMIEANRPVVWDRMLADDAFRDWTSVFAEGSHFVGSWEQGARIRFMAPDGNGLSSRIAENRLHEYLSIEHLGYFLNGVEDTESDGVRSWAPAYENYTFSDANGGTRVDVVMDATDEIEAEMSQKWPLALARLKEICEPGQ
ncbi:MAG: SRPBCC domain-containing protein [Candidatus Eisenbacteria bacterium]|nr:SRPBCC domain-containing protein [Candidatus Eisenbacteria bacterium]MCC7141029.1 SRPBCC domain-containing protein [Candidatus Eisenbacteria bacterium]